VELIHSENQWRGMWLWRLADWHWTPIENHVADPGIPDINGCKGGKEVWIELKMEPKLRSTQYAWIKKRIQVSGKVWIAWLDLNSSQIYLISGEAAVRAKLHRTQSKGDWAFHCSVVMPYDLDGAFWVRIKEILNET